MVSMQERRSALKTISMTIIHTTNRADRMFANVKKSVRIFIEQTRQYPLNKTLSGGVCGGYGNCGCDCSYDCGGSDDDDHRDGFESDPCSFSTCLFCRPFYHLFCHLFGHLCDHHDRNRDYD